MNWRRSDSRLSIKNADDFDFDIHNRYHILEVGRVFRQPAITAARFVFLPTTATVTRVGQKGQIAET